MLFICVASWFRATRSHTLDATGKSDTGRLLLALSWSPSFNNGTTSDFFQADGKTEVNKERLAITVRTDGLIERH